MSTRNIPYSEIVQQVKELCIRAAMELPSDVVEALRTAKTNETNPRAIRILEQLLENARIARQQSVPLCQDTGLTVIFVEAGCQAAVIPPHDRPSATIIDAINDGVAAGYAEGFLRKSVVAEPLCERRNTGTNTPAIVHYSVVSGERIYLSVMLKGGGCENKSQFRMFKPTDNVQTVSQWIAEVATAAGADACPPLVVGVGLGGNFEHSCLLSKKALLRKLGSHHPDFFYAEMEKTILQTINASGSGPQGLGGNTTALGVMIETAPCHIASLPVAVNIECHSHRHAAVIL